MSKSILLAEDDRFLRRACETKLKQAGFDVRVAVDGAKTAGEITGTGKSIELQGQSWCRYSGLNDTPYLDGMGQTQSYGQLVRLYPELIDPRYFNPATSYPESCNPTHQGEPLSLRGELLERPPSRDPP